jgi:REP element-mobilizing transposase RayT
MTDIFYRHLPHYHPQNATYFVTFRLAGSIPLVVLQELKRKFDEEDRLLSQRYQGEALYYERYKLHKKAFGRYDAYLDKGKDPRWLADAHIASLVAQEIHSLVPDHFHLHSYCIMSNHAHLLIDQDGIPEPPKPISGQHFTALSQAMRLLKGRSARQCNQHLGREGKFWADESYDHVVRDEKEFERILAYIVNNPVKAGLVENWQDWAFTYVT